MGKRIKQSKIKYDQWRSGGDRSRDEPDAAAAAAAADPEFNRESFIRNSEKQTRRSKTKRGALVRYGTLVLHWVVSRVSIRTETGTVSVVLVWANSS